MKSNQLNKTFRDHSFESNSIAALQDIPVPQHRNNNSNNNTNQSGMNKMYNTLKAGKLAAAFLMAMAFTVFGLQNANAQVTVAGAHSFTNGTYTTLKVAFDSINLRSQTGNTITISITGNTTETATATLNAGTWTSLTISPSGGAARTISGAITAGSPLVNLNGADNVVIDGLNTGSNSLTFNNTTVSTTSGTSTIKFIGDAVSNTVTNCTLISNFTNTTASTNGGCVWFSTGTTTGNDNNTISNCNLTTTNAASVGFTKAIAGAGSTTNATIENSGITITNNNIYDFFIPSGGSAGIYVTTGNQGWTITNNRFYQTATKTQTTSGTSTAIFISNSGNTAGGFTITGNTIGYASNSRTGTMTYAGTVSPSFTGINFTQSSTGANSTISQNHISNYAFTGTGTSVIFIGITNGTSSTSQTETITINQDTIQNVDIAASTSTCYGIQTGSAAILNVTNNYIYRITRTASGALYAFYHVNVAGLGSVFTGNTVDSIYGNSASFATTLGGLYASATTQFSRVANNTFSRIRNAGTSGTTYCMYLGASPASGSFFIDNNKISNIYGNGTQTVYGIYKGGSGTINDTFTNNKLSNINIVGAGTLYGLYIGSSTVLTKAYNDTVTDINTGGTTLYASYLTSGNVDFFNNLVTNISNTNSSGVPYSVYLSGGTTVKVYNNTFSNLSTTGSGAAPAAIYVSGGTTDSIYNNTVTGVSGTGSSAIITGANLLGGTNVYFYNNTLTSISASGTTSPIVNGIKVGGTSTTTFNVFGNTISGLTNTSGSTAPATTGIEFNSTGTSMVFNVYKNKIYDITCSGAGAVTSAIATGTSFAPATSGTVNLYNNVIGDIKAPTATGLNAVVGINIKSSPATTLFRVYFNSVYLNGTSTSGTTFGGSCVTFPSVVATTGGLDLRNNILINNIVPAQDGSSDGNNGIAAVLRMGVVGSGGTVPSFYRTTSNNNNFWYNAAAGTGNHLAYCEGLDGSATNQYNSFASYLGWIANRDQASFTDNLGSNTSPTSMDLTTSSSTYLKIAGSTLTQCESGATPISTPSITDDYSGTTRNVSNPDVGAYEFSGITPAPSISLNSITAGNQCTASSHAVSANISTPSGTLTNAVLTYTYNGSGGAANQTMTGTLGTASGTFTYSIPAATSPANATVAWSITATNSAGLSTTYTGTSYNDEPVYGSTAGAVASSSSICSGTSINLTATLLKAKTDSLGSGSSSSSSSGGTFLPGGWGGNKTQYIVRASELQALGFTAGNFTSIGFRPTAAGDTYEGFALSIGQTSQTTMTNTTMISSGLTQVYKGTTGANEGLLPVANTLNTLTFGTGAGSSSSFAWDGTSNLVLSFCWSSVPSAANATVSAMLGDILSYNCTGSGQSDNLTPAAMCALTTGFGTSTTGTFRPKFIFAGNASPAISSVSWVANPASTSLGTGNPLATVQTNTPAGNADSVRTYTATITALGCPVTATTTNVTVKAAPVALSGDTTAIIYGGGTQCGNPHYWVAVSSASSPTYKFYSASTGGTLLQSGSSNHYAAPSSTPNATNTIWASVVDGITGCESDRVSIDVYVTEPDAFTIYHSGAVNTCTNRIDTLYVTSTLSNYDTYTWAPTTNLYTNAAGTTPYTGTNRDTVYYKHTSTTSGEKITASASNASTLCNATDTVRFVVNPNPLVTAATATPSAVCSGSTVALNGQSIPATSGTATVGAGATTSTTYPAPFYSLWSNKHMQILIKAAELTSAGLTTGNLTGIKFPTTSGTIANANYSLKMKNSTGVSDMSSFVTSGFTTVYSTSSYAQTAGTDNAVTLSTPFYWDGTSDLILEICFGDGSSSATLSSTSPADNTAYVSVIKTHVSAATAASTICPDISTQVVTYTVRPQIKFVGQIGTNLTSSYTWTWSTTGVSGATIASGSTTTNAPTNVATYPNAASLTYTAKALNVSTGCYGSLAASAIAVNAIPPAPTDSSTTPQCGTAIFGASTTVTGASTFKWWSASSGGTLLQSSAQHWYSYTGGGGGATTTFWVSVVDANGCESARTPISIVINTAPTLTISPSGATNTCINTIVPINVTSTVGDFTSYTWSPQTNLYTDAGATTGYSGGSASTVYYKRPSATASQPFTLTASNSGTGCSNTTTVTFTVNALPTVTSASVTPTPVCSNSPVTLAATSIPGYGDTLAVGAGGTSVTNYNMPFYSAWSNKHMQMMFKAAELSAAGLQAGSLTSISFPTTAGTLALKDFSLGLKLSTGVSDMSSFVSGFTTVYTTSSFAQVANTKNKITFSTPFTWDGTSDLIVEICFGDNTTTATLSSTSPADNTSFVSVIKTHTSAATDAGTACGDNATNLLTYSQRPKVYFGSNNTPNFTWTWTTSGVNGSSVATGASTTHTPINGYTYPTDSSVVYTAVATNATTGCKAGLAATAVVVRPLPSAPTDNGTDLTQCGTPTYMATSTSGVSYKWYTVSTGGTAISGATAATYVYTGYSTANAPSATNNTLYVSCVDANGCESGRTAITVAVDAPLPLTINHSGITSTCINRLDSLAVTSDTTNFDSYVWSPSTNLYTDAAATTAYTGGSATKVYFKRATATSSPVAYSLTATNSGTGCVNNAADSFTVNANPVVTSVTAVTSPVCAGGTVNLVATSIPAVSDTGTITNGAATTISGNTGVPYRTTAGAGLIMKTQYLVLASEMLARGFTTGNITSLGFVLTGTASGTMTDMYLKLGNTTATALTSTFETSSTTQVFTTTTYNPVTGLNLHTFSTPFFWNGTSNILVELCNTCSVVGSATVVASTPSFVGTSQTTSGGTGCTATSTTTSTSRPVIVFGGQIGADRTSSLTWNWTSSNQAGSVATTATTTATAYNPSTTDAAASVVYTATGTDVNTCTSSLAATAITVNAAPNAPTNTSNATQCGAPTFTASSNSTLGSHTYRWYTVATGGTPISGVTGATYTSPTLRYPNANDTAWVSEVNATTGCEGARTQCVVYTSSPLPLTMTGNQTACVSSGNAILLTVTSTTSNFDHYTWSPTTNLYRDAALTVPYTGGDTVAVYVNGGVVTAGRTYTVSAYTGSGVVGADCFNSASSIVTVNSIPAITTQPTASAVCGTGSTSIFSYSSGTNTTKQWQMSADGSTGWTNVADSTPFNASGSAYYTGKTGDTLFINRLSTSYYYRLVVSNSGCSSATSSAVIVNAGIPSIVSYTTATRCGTGSVSLTATPSAGALVRWYDAASGGTLLATSTTPGATSTYTASIGATANYWAEPVVMGTVTPNNLGRDTTVIPAATGLSSERGIIFRCTKSGVINSAYIYTPTTGTITPTIRLTDSATSTTIGSSFTAPFTSTGAGWYKMDLNIPITAGNAYRLLATWSNSVNGYTSGVDYTSSAWNSLGAYGIIRAGSDIGTVSSTGYWYFSGISISDFAACTGTRQKDTATVTTPPSVTIAPASVTICAGSSTTLTGSSSNDPNYQYTWKVGATTVGTGATLTVSPSATTTYVLTAVDTTSGSNAGCNLTSSRTVTVNPKPTSINPTNNASGTICNGTAVNLSVTASAGTGATITGYAWSSSPIGYTSATQNPTGVTPSASTTYKVKVTNNFGCVDSNTTSVTVYPKASAVISGTTAVCAGDSATISVALSGTAPWSYTYTDGTTPVNVSVSSSPYVFKVAPTSTKTYTSSSLADNYCTALGGELTGSAVITVNAKPTASITGGSTYCPSTATTLTASASAGSGTITGYQWNLAGAPISGATSSTYDASATGSYTVTVTNSNGCSTTSAAHSMTVTQYSITASAGSNGSISPAGVTTKNCETSQAYTFTPSSCYQVDSVFVDGSYVDSTDSYTFNSITANHTINVKFKLIPYTITLSPGAHGSISGSTSVNCGANSTYTIAADACYTITDVTVDGTSVGAVTTYQLVNVTAPHTIVATFAITTYNIVASAGSNGSISPSGTSTVNCGADSTFTITPNAGYGILDVLVDGVTNAGAIAAGTYTFTALAANHTISASFYDTLCPNPPTGSAGANATICAGANYTLGGTIGGGASSATWTTSGTGTFNGSGVFGTATTYTPSAADTAAGSVIITLTTDNPGGSCTPAVSDLTLTIKPLATASISGAATICYGTSSSISFTGTPNAVVTYTVNGGSNQTITLNGAGSASLNTGSLTANTTYALVSAATGGTPNCTNSASGSATVTVKSLPTASASPTAANVCNNTSTSINFTGTANATVTYNINGGSDLTITLDGSGAGSVSTGNLTSNATYNLTSIADNGTPNCSNTLSSSTTVTVIPNPTAGISGTTTICTGASTSVSFTGTANATVTYTINGGSNLTVALNGTGNGSVSTGTLTADATYALVSVATAGSPSCSTSASGSAVVTVSTPTISITSACSSPIAMLTGNTYNFSANAAGGPGSISTYQWKRDGGNIGTNSPNLNNQSTAGSYTLTTTNSFGCSVTSAAVVMSAPAALNGTYTIGSSGCANFSSFANAFSQLNTYGVTGSGATFNVVSAYTETAPAGGLSLGTATLNASLSASSPVVFQKASGTNPLITANGGQTAGYILDAVVKLVGVDYVTFDAIDVRENPSNTTTTLATNTMTEIGYGLFYRDTTDGAQRNTIQNCTITMNRTYPNSFGIYSNTKHSAKDSLTIALPLKDATTQSGSNSYNKIYSNTITNTNYGIAFIGAGTSVAMDTLNDIGGSSTGTGNTITNYGSNSAQTATYTANLTSIYAIWLNQQKGFNASYNNITSATGVANTGGLRGIVSDYQQVSPAATSTYTNNVVGNTISLNSAATSGTFQDIFLNNSSTAIPSSGTTINLNNNNCLSNVVSGTSSSSVIVGIVSSCAVGTLNMNNNVFRSNTSTATTGGMTAFQNTGAVVNTININNNQIGNATGGAITYSAATSGATAGISNTGGAATARAYILGNDFRGITHSVTASSAHTYINNTAAVLSDSICGNTFTRIVAATSGSVTFLSHSHTIPANGLQTVSNNSIVDSFYKSVAGGTITLSTSSASSTAGAVITHSNNNFSNIRVLAATTIAGWISSDGGSANKIYTNNTFRNWIGGSSAVTAMSIGLGGGAGGFGNQISSNTVRNITGTGAITGITAVSGTVVRLASNTVDSLFSTGTGGTVLGISATGTTSTVLSNVISRLSTTSTTGNVTGLTISGATADSVYKNKVYDLAGTATTTGTITGMSITAGTTVNAYNNIIGDLRATTATGAAAINGITVSGGTAVNLYYNSVLLNATGGTTFGSSALYVSSTTPTVTARNNNFVNNSTPGSTSGASAGLRYVSAPGAKYSTSSNNNNYYAGTAAANKLIYVEGTTTLANGQQTLAAYKTYIGSKDGASTTENPTYVSTVSSNANFLNIDGTAPTTLESGAATIAGITDDYAGNTRNTSTPDIGAWEFTGVLNDIVAPAIGTPVVAAPCNGSTYVATVAITDATGVYTVGSLVPRIYYYRKTPTVSSWYSTAGTLTSGTSKSGNWSFTINASDFGGTAVGDTIGYYIIAQDSATGNNLTANPSSGLVATNVNTVTTNPTSPLLFRVQNTLNGSYTVGSPTSNYTTLTAAITDYNNACLAGPVTFLLDSTKIQYSTVAIAANSQASATNTLTIKPNTGLNVTVYSKVSAAATSIFNLAGADYVTIDGSNNGTNSQNLTITDSSTSGTYATVLLGSLGTGAGATNNTIKNCIINGGSSTLATGYAISIGGTTAGTGGADNDNNTVRNNTITTAYWGIYANGSATTNPGAMDNLSIDSNVVGSTTIAKYVTTYGITVGNGLTSSVSKNNIFNIVNTLTVSPEAIHVIAGFTNSSITRNRIDSVYTSNTGGYGGRGIVVGTADAASNLTIANNVISSVSGASNWSAFGNSSTMGIALGVTTTTLTTVTGGVNLWNNTVYLAGNYSGGTTSIATAALYVGSAVTNLDARNNIFRNSLVDIGTNAASNKAYAIYSAAANTAFANINYNDYYVTGTQGVLAFLGSDQTTLAALTTAFGGNANSLNVQPNFTSVSDVHLVTTTNCALNGTAASIGAVTTDYDGDTRSGTPDIGADEFNSTYSFVTNPVIVCGGTGNLTAGAVTTGSVVGAGTTYTYWTDAGATASYATPAAAIAGTYYIKALSGSCTSIQPVTVTVNTASTAPTSASATDTIICNGNSTTLTQLGGVLGTSAQWMWYSDAGFTTKVDSSSASNGSITVNPSSATTYYVRATGTAAPCTSNTASTSRAIAVISVNGSYSHNWKGGTSTNWSTASNWCTNTVPTSTSDVNITSGSLIFNQPALTANSSVHNVNLATSGASLSIGSGLALSANGNVAKTGNMTGSGTLVLNGTSTQTLSGAGTIPTNLTINNTGANAVLGSNTSVSGVLTLTAGNLDVNANTLTLGGSVSGSTSILATASGSTVVLVGPATVPTQLGSSVANLTINREGGVAMASDLTVTEGLTQTSGKFALAAHTLTLAGSISNDATNSLTTDSLANIVVTTGSGTAYFDQTTSADVFLKNGTNALNNLTKSGTGTFTIGNKLNLFNRLSSTGGTINLNGNVVLRSTSTNTARVGVVSGTITGQAIVERYMHHQQRGWRAITAPITYNGLTITDSSNSLKRNWQSNWGYGSGYGTRITGPSTWTPSNPVNFYTRGFDDSTVGYSVQTYNSVTGAWGKVTNTWTELQSGNSATAANKSFYIFVRGDRTVTPTTSTPNSFDPTTLAAKGLLQTGTQVFNFTGTANKSWLVGNPYACPVDMSTVDLSNAIYDYIYVWDPNITGFSQNTSGNYVTFDKTAWAAGASAGTNNKYFQSGQAFFVKPTSSSSSITFNESDKVDTNNTQHTGTMNGLADIFNIKLMSIKGDGSKTEVDGVRAKFGAAYSAGVDDNDADKWLTPGIENMSLLRNTKSLVIEARPYILTTDSLFLNMSSLIVGANYEYKVNPINFDASVASCKLVDRFLNTETPVSLTSVTTIGFNVTSVAGSSAANRFYVVFNGAGSLPTNGLTVKAYKKNKTVVIDWEAIAENNVKVYNVEKSIDGTNFSKLGEAAAKNANATSEYSLVDNNPVVGVNYYRIKTIQNNSNTVYSRIVRVEMTDKGVKSITVYPNPVKGSTIGVQMSNLEAGVYTARLFNSIGQQVWTNSITHNGNNGSISLDLGKVLAAGSYQLSFTDTKGNSFNQSIAVVE